MYYKLGSFRQETNDILLFQLKILVKLKIKGTQDSIQGWEHDLLHTLKECYDYMG
jgi:hypothetical protein